MTKMRSLSQTNQLAAALIVIIFMFALSFPQKDKESKGQHSTDRLSEIRDWALQHNLWTSLKENSLIAVRQVYYTEEQSQLKFSVYLLVPCTKVCGESESCARSCQNNLIQQWDGNGIYSGLLMIEAFDSKEQVSLGRLVLQDIAPIKLRYFSRKHGLIALIQTKSEQDRILHLIKLGNEDENKQLEYYDQLQLGQFHGEESPLEGSISFKTAPNGQLEMLAPLESLTKLKPAFYLPVPYQLQPQGLRLAPQRISLKPPKPHDLRNWLISVRGTDLEAMHPDRIKATLSFALLLCLTKQCEIGEDLLKFAYPQNELVLNLWEQLRAYVDQVGEAQTQSVKPGPSQYSILDR